MRGAPSRRSSQRTNREGSKGGWAAIPKRKGDGHKSSVQKKLRLRRDRSLRRGKRKKPHTYTKNLKKPNKSRRESTKCPQCDSKKKEPVKRRPRGASARPYLNASRRRDQKKISTSSQGNKKGSGTANLPLKRVVPSPDQKGFSRNTYTYRR